MIRLTELKGTRTVKKTTFELEDSNREGLRKLVAAVICRDNIDEDDEEGNLVCNGERSEKWCHAMGFGIEDFLRLGDSKIKIRPKDVKNLRKAVKTLEENDNFFKKGSKKRDVPSSEFMSMLNALRPLDELWELCSDIIKIDGHDLDRNEIVKLIAWLKTCRGFVLNASE